MDLMDLFVKIGVKDEASSGISQVTNAIGGGIATAAKVGTAAVTAAGAAVTSLTTQAVGAFADYEQLTGGVETLFGESADLMMIYAKNAYKTAGMSTNEYMETATSFAASLVSSVKAAGGSMDEAVEYADLAMSDMSDNANKMGSDLSSIQNAYQGFAKQNYTMLDNLKLGYGGTKEEMERLIEDANTLRHEQGITSDLSIESFADIVTAIHTVQTEMGVTGTTALEASTTISGSIGSMKAAWENVLTALSGGTETFAYDIEETIEQLLDTILGEDGNGGVLANIEPVVLAILNNIPVLLERLTPILVETLDAIVNNLLPPLIESVTGIITSASGLIPSIVTMLVENAPLIMDAGIAVLSALATGLVENIDLIVDSIVQLIEQLTAYITENANEVTKGSIEIIIALSTGLIQALPTLLAAIPEIIAGVVTAFIEELPKILQCGADLVSSLIDGIFSMIESFAETIADLITNIENPLQGVVDTATTWGRDLIENFVSGIKEKWQHLCDTLSSAAATVKDFLGFSEPKRGPLSNFHTYAPDMMELFAQGIKDNEDVVTAQINKSFDFGVIDVPKHTSFAGSVANAVQEIVINVTEQIDGEILARNQYRYNIEEQKRHGVSLIKA